MSRFEALRNEYSLPAEVKPARTQILRSAVQSVFENLVNFLELPVWSFTDLDGQEMPYISVGSVQGGQFRLRKIEDLVGGADGLHFSINIVLDEAVDQFPKAFIYFSFTVDEQDGELTIVSHSAPCGPATFKGADFTPISAHIHSVICAELIAFNGSKLPAEMSA